MKVVQLVRYGSIQGGAETYVASLAHGLRAAGHEVALVYGLEPDHRRDEVAHGRHVPGLGTGIEDRDALKAALGELRPDVVHAHLPDEPWTVEVADAVAPTLLAVHDHRLDCPTGTRYHTAWRRICHVEPGAKCLAYNVVAHCGSLRANLTLRPYRRWKHASGRIRERDGAVHVFSDEMAARLEPILGRRPSVTPYPTPPAPRPASHPATGDVLLAPELLAPSAAAARAEADRRPVVLAIGRINKEKGFRQLVEAISLVTTPCHLVVVGDGHDRDGVERLASQARGGHRITFTGWLDASERARWLDRARLVAVPSMWPEPFGIVGLEAMSAGKAVVAFDAGGISTWLDHERTGILVPHGDLRRLAEAITRLLDDAGAAERMGVHGREDATTRFGLREHVAAIEALYRSLAS